MNVIDQTISDTYAMYHGDCVTTLAGLPEGSVHFSVYSPPFANLYIYSDDVRDMGNCENDEQFFQQYSFLIRELHRVTMPGRLSAVHCKDLPLYRNRDDAAGLSDFPGRIIRAHCEDDHMAALVKALVFAESLPGTDEAGDYNHLHRNNLVWELKNAIEYHAKRTVPTWVYHSRVTIWKDPVTEMQRTKNHGLLHKNFSDRAEVCRQGMADYLLVFRKWDGVEGTESPEPVKHALVGGTGGHTFIGDEPPVNYDDDRDYSIQVWQRYASPVWFDIRQGNVLKDYQRASDGADEKHICPLQLDVIERAIDLWTNPGDIVLSPFAGVGSEGHCAVRMGRRFIGVELKKTYYDFSCATLRNAEAYVKAPRLDFGGEA